MPGSHRFSRRKFLQFTGALTGAAVAFNLPDAMAQTEGMAAAPSPPSEEQALPLARGLMFCTNDVEFATLSAASERIFPGDDNGPGALDLAVPYFIDNQLAGAYGYNTREYMAGPHSTGAATQGYQLPLLRRDLFRQGFLGLNLYAQEQFAQDFADLSAQQQDQVLSACESGSIPMRGFSSSLFFSLLKSAVLAGAYADPIYNGNNNMDGWRLKQYPGAQRAYGNIIESPDFVIIEPVSLASMR